MRSGEIERAIRDGECLLEGVLRERELSSRLHGDHRDGDRRSKGVGVPHARLHVEIGSEDLEHLQVDNGRRASFASLAALQRGLAEILPHGVAEIAPVLRGGHTAHAAAHTLQENALPGLSFRQVGNGSGRMGRGPTEEGILLLENELQQEKTIILSLNCIVHVRLSSK